MDKESIVKLTRHNAELLFFIFFEECGELMKEISKYIRGNHNVDSIKEEVGDCLIMIEQIKVFFNIKDEDLEEIINQKITRTLEREGIKWVLTLTQE